MVSLLNLPNESCIKLDLFILDIKERRVKEKKALKHAKNNLSIKPDVHEHNQEKYLRINLWITAIWNVGGEDTRAKAGGGVEQTK